MSALGRDDTICALASAPGAGAIGVVRLSGPLARSLLQRVSGALPAARRLLPRTIVDPRDQRVLDSALVCSMPGPHSYTGEDVVEVFGHGGPLNMRALLELFVALGARQAEAGEFTRRAFLHGKLDLNQAEAVAEIVSARSERALRNAQAVLAGRLGARIGALRSAAIELAAELEACIDFADELQLAASHEVLLGRFDDLLSSLAPLRASYRLGARLDGVSVALLGSVNVGKSSLFNALLGKRRALVSPAAGTTRDYLEAELGWQGFRVTLVDTAGERSAMTALERAGHELGAARVAECDLRLRLIDGTSAPRALSGEAGRDLFVLTKVDLLDEARRAAWRQQGGAELLFTSVQSGEGLAELPAAVLQPLWPAVPDGADGAETVCITQARQAADLARAERALEAGRAAQRAGLVPELVVEHVQAALAALGELTGETYREDVLSALFSRFCVGK